MGRTPGQGPSFAWSADADRVIFLVILNEYNPQASQSFVNKVIEVLGGETLTSEAIRYGFIVSLGPSHATFRLAAVFLFFACALVTVPRRCCLAASASLFFFA